MNPPPLLPLVLGVLLVAAGSSPPPAERPLTVTEGQLRALPGGRQRIDAPKVRAVEGGGAVGGAVREARLRFTYLGPTAKQVPLRSGEQRRQVGLKLRARDGCNVVYVMWRLSPQPVRVVSVKANPGQTRSVQCGNGGYSTVKARHQVPLPAFAQDEPHTLATRLEGARLRVEVDGAAVWEGELPAEALAFDGPTGLRSDNGRFEVELHSGP